MSSSEIAAKEAFEEAGVIGYISPNFRRNVQGKKAEYKWFASPDY
jgi:hypothetical protein